MKTENYTMSDSLDAFLLTIAETPFGLRMSLLLPLMSVFGINSSNPCFGVISENFDEPDKLIIGVQKDGCDPEAWRAIMLAYSLQRIKANSSVYFEWEAELNAME